MLDKLRELTDGNEARMHLYIETYTEALEENLPKLNSAISRNNLLEIRTVAHTLKPLFTIMGFEELWELANTIETNIDLNKELDSVPDLSKNFFTQLKCSIDNLN